MRPTRVLAVPLLTLLLFVPGTAAQDGEADLPCLHPVDVRCLVQEVSDEVDTVADHGHDLLLYAEDVADWVECQLTSLIWCGQVPQPPLPPYVDAAPAQASTAPSDQGCDLHTGCDLGPCAYVQVGPGTVVDPGSLGCYATYLFDTIGKALEDGVSVLEWLGDLVDWVECVQNGGGIECDSPPGPRQVASDAS